MRLTLGLSLSFPTELWFAPRTGERPGGAGAGPGVGRKPGLRCMP